MSSLKKDELQELYEHHVRDAEDEPMYADGPDGKPDRSKPMKIGLYGPGTPQFAKAEAERNNRLGAIYRRKGNVKLDADQARNIRCEFLVGVTKYFENIESDHGFTGEDLYREVYLNLKLTHVAEQAELNARNTANFKKPSTTSSAAASGTQPG